jgi:hypothetical protein
MYLTDDELRAVLGIAAKLERCGTCKARLKGKPFWTEDALHAWDKLNSELEGRHNAQTQTEPVH